MLTFPIREDQFKAWLEGKGDGPCGGEDKCPLEVAVQELAGRLIVVGYRAWYFKQEKNWSPGYEQPHWAIRVVQRADLLAWDDYEGRHWNRVLAKNLWRALYGPKN